MPKENFKDKINTAGFDKNPENINKTGANRKSIASANLELEAKGYKAASKQDILDCYMRLINIDLPELTAMVADVEGTGLIRIVGKAILSGKGFDVIERMLDRGIGKAVNPIDLNVKTEQPLFPDVYTDNSDK